MRRPSQSSTTPTFHAGDVVETLFDNDVWYEGVVLNMCRKGKGMGWMRVAYTDGDIFVIHPNVLLTYTKRLGCNELPNAPIASVRVGPIYQAELPNYRPNSLVEERGDKLITLVSLSHHSLYHHVLTE